MKKENVRLSVFMIIASLIVMASGLIVSVVSFEGNQSDVILRSKSIIMIGFMFLSLGIMFLLFLFFVRVFISSTKKNTRISLMVVAPIIIVMLLTIVTNMVNDIIRSGMFPTAYFFNLWWYLKRIFVGQEFWYLLGIFEIIVTGLLFFTPKNKEQKK